MMRKRYHGYHGYDGYDRGVVLYVVAVLTAATAVLVAALAGLSMRSDEALLRQKDEARFDVFVCTFHMRAKQDLSGAIGEGGLRAYRIDKGERVLRKDGAGIRYRYIPRDTFFGAHETLDEEEAETLRRLLPKVNSDRNRLKTHSDDLAARISDEWVRRRLEIGVEEFYGDGHSYGLCSFLPLRSGRIDVNSAPPEALEVMRGQLGDELTDFLLRARRSGQEVTRELLEQEGLHPSRERLSGLSFVTRNITVVCGFRGGKMKREFLVHLSWRGEEEGFAHEGYERIR